MFAPTRIRRVGVTTCDADGYPCGLTMSAVFCVSLDPALFLISIGKQTETLDPLLKHGAFAINVLSAEQKALAQFFASKGGCDKFRHVALSAERPSAIAGAARRLGSDGMQDCRCASGWRSSPRRRGSPGHALELRTTVVAQRRSICRVRNRCGRLGRQQRCVMHSTAREGIAATQMEEQLLKPFCPTVCNEHMASVRPVVEPGSLDRRKWFQC